MLYSFVHKSNLQPKLHRVIGQLPSPPCCTLVPFLAVFSACLRMRGFAFLLSVIISTKQYSERQPPPQIVSLDSADLSGCTGSRSAMCEWPNAGLPVWEYWLPKVKSLESHARAIIAFAFKQKHKAGQPAVRQPSGYTSQSPAGSKCIVGYPSKLV